VSKKRQIKTLSSQPASHTEKQKRMEHDWKEHTKEMRRLGMSDCAYATLDEYIRYRHGKVRKTKPRKDKSFVPTYAVRETAYHGSLETNACETSRKETPAYTGTYIKGIATMHKSNAVPIGSDDDAESYAKMRRG